MKLTELFDSIMEGTSVGIHGISKWMNSAGYNTEEKAPSGKDVDEVSNLVRP